MAIKIHKRKGGDRTTVGEIASNFKLVKRSYDDIMNMLLDIDGTPASNFMPEYNNSGVMLPNSVFIGKSNEGETIVIISKNADEALIKSLENLPQPVTVYVSNNDIEYSGRIDHEVDDENNRNFSATVFSIYADTVIDGDKHTVLFDITDSWNTGNGIVNFVNFSMSGVATEPRVIITKSEIYTPEGELRDIFKMDEDAVKELENAREEYKNYEKATEDQDYYDYMESTFYNQDDNNSIDMDDDRNDYDYFGGNHRRGHRMTVRKIGHKHKHTRGHSRKTARKHHERKSNRIVKSGRKQHHTRNHKGGLQKKAGNKTRRA